MTDRMGWGWSFGTQAVIVVVFAVVFVPVLLVWGGRMREWRGPLTLRVTEEENENEKR